MVPWCAASTGHPPDSRAAEVAPARPRAGRPAAGEGPGSQGRQASITGRGRPARWSSASWLATFALLLPACGPGAEASPARDHGRPPAPTAAPTAADAPELAAANRVTEPRSVQWVALTPATRIEEPAYLRVEGRRGLRLRAPGCFEGYTLIAPLRSTSVFLVDMDGRVAHAWSSEHVNSGPVLLTDEGHLLRASLVEDNPRFRGGGMGGRLEELGWDGEVLWSWELASAQRTLHHDFKRLPSGNLLAIAWEHHGPEAAFARGRAADFIPRDGLWFDMLVEVRPQPPRGGRVVWTWRSFDHLVQDERPGALDFGRPADHPGRIDINADHRFAARESEAEGRERHSREGAMAALGYGSFPAESSQWDDSRSGASRGDQGGGSSAAGERFDADWLHANGLDYLPEEDLIVLSVSHLSEVWVIDHSTTTADAATSRGGRFDRGGDLLFRHGAARNHGAPASPEPELYFQHDPTWIVGARRGEYGLLVFDNGTRRPGGEFSRVLELRLPFDSAHGFADPSGRGFGSASTVWSYQDPERFFTPFVGGAERLPNGNTLICEGARGRIFEVTRSGQVVWDFLNPLGGDAEPTAKTGRPPAHALFRATRIPRDHPGLAGRL